MSLKCLLKYEFLLPFIFPLLKNWIAFPIEFPTVWILLLIVSQVVHLAPLSLYFLKTDVRSWSDFCVQWFAKCYSMSFQDPFKLKKKWASVWEQRSHFKQSEATFPVVHVHVLRDFPLLSLSKFNDNIEGKLLNWIIFSIKTIISKPKTIISKPKTTPHVLWILQVPVPSTLRIGVRKLKNSLHCSI